MKELQVVVAQIGLVGGSGPDSGRTGSGKEVLARELHAQSPRANRPFLKLNCAALPSELVESELFGYERGAFTGAFQKKAGKFEIAEGGTILLDEIGDMTCGSRLSCCRSCKTTSSTDRRQGNHPGGRSHHGRHPPRSREGDCRGYFREDFTTA